MKLMTPDRPPKLARGGSSGLTYRAAMGGPEQAPPVRRPVTDATLEAFFRQLELLR